MPALNRQLSNGKSPKVGRLSRAVKFSILVMVVSTAYLIETAYDVNEQLDEFFEHYEHVNMDAFFIGTGMFLLTWLLLKITDLRGETRRRSKAEQHALKLAYHDSLTGLPNRRSLESALSTIDDGCRAVMMLDLDDFKPVNDIFGHAAGDLVLLAAAERLRSVCGKEALVCRFGGDEFAVMTGIIADQPEAEALAHSIAAAFEQPFMVGSSEVRIGVATGIAMLPLPGEEAAQAIRHADIALYRAKEDSHQHFQVYQQDMDEMLRSRKRMEQRLRAALDNGSLRPFFQPVIDLETARLIGFEALARWSDAELGQVPPSDFITLAEETGQITKISEHLLRLACREAVKWPSHIKLSFNLSPKQLKDKMIGLRVLGILGETGLSPHRLEIEVTEGSLVEDHQLAQHLLNGLRSAGVRIAIDDFGTGYSSLYHLLQFKFDTLKIDRSFVSAAEKADENDVIVKAILALSRGLGLTSTAEGIERDEHVAKLAALGCQLGQGYLFGKAMPGEDAIEFVRRDEEKYQSGAVVQLSRA